MKFVKTKDGVSMMLHEPFISEISSDISAEEKERVKFIVGTGGAFANWLDVKNYATEVA